jgi:hypothetical protein
MREDVVESPQSSSSRPWTLMALLAGVALVFSYLGAFAVTNALVAADVVEKWAPGSDPRPRWMISGFVASMIGFGLIAMLLKWSGRQMQRIDDLEEPEIHENTAA